nr:paired amphipathic helix protein Sin3-like 2 [Ipomoea batatas]
MFGKVCKLTIDDGNCYNINTKVLDWHLGLEIETEPKLYMEHQVDSGNLMVEAFTENVMTHGKIKAKGSFSGGGGSGGSGSSSGLPKGKKVWEESEQDAGMDELLAVHYNPSDLSSWVDSMQDDLSNSGKPIWAEGHTSKSIKVEEKGKCQKCEMDCGKENDRFKEKYGGKSIQQLDLSNSFVCLEQ